MVTGNETELAWGNGFDEKGTDKLEFVDLVQHDDASTQAFAAEADRYFAAFKAYEDLTSKAEVDGEHAKELLAKAEGELRSAKAGMKQQMFIEPLDEQLTQHKKVVDYYIKQAKGIAEMKGKPAADWKLDDLDGKSHALADYRGKVVLLDFWYRGCGWCIRDDAAGPATLGGLQGRAGGGARNE